MGEFQFESENVDLEEVLGSLDPIEKAAVEDRNLNELAAMYREAYDEVEIRSRELKKATKKRRAFEILLHDAIRDQGINSIKTDDGYFGLDKTPKCVINKERKDEFLRALEEHGLGDLIQRTVPWPTLNKAYKDGALKEVIADHPETVKTWEEKGINIRRASGTLP